MKAARLARGQHVIAPSGGVPRRQSRKTNLMFHTGIQPLNPS